jgi:predicted metalloendopeptidase
MRDPVANYNPMTIKNLTSTVPNIDWHLLVSKLQASTVPVETFIVESPHYLTSVGKLIAETDVMTVRYHFMNVLIFALIDTLSTSIRAPDVKLSAVLDGVKVVPPRWKTCMRNIEDVLGQLVGRYYAVTKFGTDAQSFSDAFLHTIRNSLEQRLQALDFLDDVTRQKSLDKVCLMPSCTSLMVFSENC